MASFEQAIQYVLDNEGQDSNDTADHGGRTRFGITKDEAYRHGWDVTKLTLDQAKAIYKADYWRFDGIMSQRIATKLLDMAANLGIGTAIRITQRALRVSADGFLGPATLQVINTNVSTEEAILLKLCCEAMRRYSIIVTDDRTQIVFLRGWMERALKLP